MQKKLFFLIMMMAIIFSSYKVVKAEEYKFYEAEYLDKIYMNKYDYATNTIYYQKARKFRNQRNGEVVYCIEPLTFFNESSTYETTTTPRNLTEQQINRIKKIAYFGFRYPGHEDGSWYAVAQIMIWRESNPTGGDYYFTDTLNGNRTNIYDWQIDEINRMIAEYDAEIPIQNQTITMIEGTEKEIEIGNKLNYYTSNQKAIILEDGKIKINALEEGEYNIALTRTKENIFGTPFIMYQSPNSQTLMLGGDLEEKEVEFKVKVISNLIELEKIDEETTSPQGDAKLDGALYELYDEKQNVVETIEIIDGKGTIKNIPFGDYTLKEIQAGEGYTLNDTIYEIHLTEENPNAHLKVIQKEVTIKKQYGEKENLQPEENITFEIINQKNEVVHTIKTNQEGISTFTIPYGTYTIKQINTTEGYELLNPFELIIKDTELETIELFDYKIPVPNTSTRDNKLFYLIMILLLLC